jgi:competence ComEA-like helix-hairpin-helix protein
LAELERLPGIGFILAQQIVNYREAHGSFVQVEDLLRVPGFTPENLADVKDQLFVEVSQEAVTILLEAPGLVPVKEQAPTELDEARAMLNKGELKPAFERYARLIQSNQLLSQMVDDLKEAAGRYPEEFDVWLNLGDTHLRLNQVHDALQAYFKAEELLR